MMTREIIVFAALFANLVMSVGVLWMMVETRSVPAHAALLGTLWFVANLLALVAKSGGEPHAD